METQNQTTPYAYLIGWSALKMYYYGIRYAEGCHPSDLWVSYFTSSRGEKTVLGDSVLSFRSKHGEPDIISIRRIFKTKEECVRWENRLLTRIDAKNHPNFLNKANSYGDFHSTAGFAAAKTKENISIGLVSVLDERWLSGEIVSANKGTTHKKPQSYKDKLSRRLKGVPKNKESVEKRRKTVTEKDEYGVSVASSSAVKANITKRLNNNHEAAYIKANQTKMKPGEDGKSILQKAIEKAIKTLSIVGEDGLTIPQRSALKRLKSTTYEDRALIAEKAAKTMSIVQENGKTIREMSTEKAKITKSDKEERYDVLRGDEVIYQNVPLSFVYGLSKTLRTKTNPENSIGFSSGKRILLPSDSKILVKVFLLVCMSDVFVNDHEEKLFSFFYDFWGNFFHIKSRNLDDFLFF